MSMYAAWTLELVSLFILGFLTSTAGSSPVRLLYLACFGAGYTAVVGVHRSLSLSLTRGSNSSAAAKRFFPLAPSAPPQPSAVTRVSAERQRIAREAGQEARAVVEGRQSRVRPIAASTPGGRPKNRYWVVIRDRFGRICGETFDRWFLAPPLCLGSGPRRSPSAAVFHCWPSKSEAQLYLEEALPARR